MTRLLMVFLAILSAISFGKGDGSHCIWDVNKTPIDVIWQRVIFAHNPVVTPPEPTLIGGSVPNMRDYPATSFTGSCTTTLIGNRVAIIAAHCTDGMSANISFPIGASRYSAKCTDAKSYSGNSTADWSLCKTTKVVEGVEFETLNIDSKHLSIGDKVLLGGYGCTKPGGAGGIDGQFRIGVSEVTQLPSGKSNDIVTKNGAALCFGDSGGAAWSLNPDGTRNKLISVNSRGDIATTSYLSATSTQQFDEFIDGWVAANPEVSICGYHDDAEGCRGEQPKEPVIFKVGVLNVLVRPGLLRPDAVKNALVAVGF